MPFKRTSEKPLYLALTKAEITELKSGFGLRSTATRVDSYAGRAHVLKGHYSTAAAAAAHPLPADAVFHVRVRPQAIENFDHAAIDDKGCLLLVASEPFALNLYEFEVHVPNVQTQAWDWLAVRYYGLAATDFNELVIARAHNRSTSAAKPASLSRAQWFAMMRRTGQFRAARAA